MTVFNDWMTLLKWHVDTRRHNYDSMTQIDIIK